MVLRHFGKKNVNISNQRRLQETDTVHITPLVYSWVINKQLAIGPMPRTNQHWTQLKNDGFSSRFSCCYPHEHIFYPIPSYWESTEVSLPDHRVQESLTIEKLTLAINTAVQLIDKSKSPLYLHCFAGQERSVLLAVGIVSILKDFDLFDSLNYVRQCHRRAKPLYEQLDLLESALKALKSN